MVARLEDRGYQFESDPGFLDSMEGWIEGRIEIPELRAIYMNLLRSRHRRLNK